MSTTILAVVGQLLSLGLPAIGVVNVGSAELTSTIQTLLVVFSGLWIWYRRVSVGDVNVFGQRN